MTTDSDIKLTAYSHGAGCGCKIAPAVLKEILQSYQQFPTDPNLLVGYESSDDAAVYDLGNGTSIISTTDFFMPIVDDPETFGRIAATNAISDIYAMGGKPIMAIAILGWPVNKLPAKVASLVVEGGRKACFDAGIRLAGGHSIDAPEPIFGLAVTGIVQTDRVKRNNRALPGSELFLTKPLGVGILSTAQKQGHLKPEHAHIAPESMCKMNSIGSTLAEMPDVLAMTDVTGFGLMGHLLELCEGSGVSAQIDASKVPVLPAAMEYLKLGCVPGGTLRNFDSYGSKLGPMSETAKHILCDPQTSGGLLVAVDVDVRANFLKICQEAGQFVQSIGMLAEQLPDAPVITLTQPS